MRAVAELGRAADLGRCGVGIGSAVHGWPIDHADMWLMYEQIQALDLPIFIHPINPFWQPRIHDYRIDLIVAFPLDTTVAAVRLVYDGGVLERFPRLRVCLAHLGGALPIATSPETFTSNACGSTPFPGPARDRERILGANSEAFLKGPA